MTTPKVLTLIWTSLYWCPLLNCMTEISLWLWTCGIPHHAILGWACASATPTMLTRWNICCQDEKNRENKDVEDEEEETEAVRGSIPSLQPPQSLDGCYFSPLLVADWFWSVVGTGGRRVAEKSSKRDSCSWSSGAEWSTNNADSHCRN